MADIKRRFKSNCTEINIEHNGNSYLVICGKHINGGFCAFPKLNISTELSAYDGDYRYNEKKLRLAFNGRNIVDTAHDISVLSEIITNSIQETPDVLPF